MFSSGKCSQCEGKLKDAFSFCPYCGLDLRNPNSDTRDFGMLGKNDFAAGTPLRGGGGLGISDKLINSIFSSLMKNVEGQMKNLNQDFDSKKSFPEIQRLPNGIKIKLGGFGNANKTEQKKTPKVITEEQVKRMSKLPRSEAKADIRRFSDKVIYELNAVGVEDVNDIFVSKLETGYEVKAIGKSKVYVNSLPINLPLKKYYLKNKKLSIEFGLQ